MSDVPGTRWARDLFSRPNAAGRFHFQIPQYGRQIAGIFVELLGIAQRLRLPDSIREDVIVPSQGDSA